MSYRERGENFAKRVGEYLASQGHVVSPEYPVEVGLSSLRKKIHRFDFGNETLVVECKYYDWTEGGNNPSAKISTLNEAMMYFHSAPQHYKKMIFVAATNRKGSRNSETFAEYYVRLHSHFIPDDTEVWELESENLKARRIDP